MLSHVEPIGDLMKTLSAFIYRVSASALVLIAIWSAGTAATAQAATVLIPIICVAVRVIRGAGELESNRHKCVTNIPD